MASLSLVAHLAPLLIYMTASTLGEGTARPLNSQWSHLMANVTAAPSVVKLSLAKITILGLSEKDNVLQWAVSFVLTWNDTRLLQEQAAMSNSTNRSAALMGSSGHTYYTRLLRQQQQQQQQQTGWTPAIGVEAEPGANGSMTEIWGRHHAVRAVAPGGQVTLRIRAALRTRCRVPASSPAFPFDTRTCPLRLGNRRSNRLLLSNASISAAACGAGWSIKRVRIQRSRRGGRRGHPSSSSSSSGTGSGGNSAAGDASDGSRSYMYFQLELGRSLALYWLLLAALPLATLALAAAAAALTARWAGSREGGMRFMDCGCVVVGCCLLALAHQQQSSDYLQSSLAD